jgi:hypothetical protein
MNFVYDLSNYAVSNSVHVALNGKVISEYLIGKDLQGRGHGVC